MPERSAAARHDADDLSHRLRRMRGRDPHEQGRAASPLELLFDLTFVVAVGVAADRLAGLVALGHVGAGVLAFVFAMFAILVGWINFSWFASAFATDDWAYRLCTMVQMVGVVLLALGLPATFKSIEDGKHIDVRMLVAGYVVMRVGMLLLWLRAAAQASAHRHVCLRNALSIVIVQVAWVILAVLDLDLTATFVIIIVLGGIELLIPVLTQGSANGTPWHPHHIAERYSAFAIIVLGEGVVGTLASSSGVLGGATTINWDVAPVIVSGIGLTFAMWWTYFLVPFGDLLQHRPRRGYLFGYGHIPVLMAIAAAGAGLHGAGLYLEQQSALSRTGVTLAVVVPVAAYLAGVYGLHELLISAVSRLHIVLLSATGATLAVAVVVSTVGAPVQVSLLLAMLAVFVTVVGYEVTGHQEQRAQLDGLAREGSADSE